MPKKIVICCDGTGNEIKENQSNVLKFYRVLKEDKSQNKTKGVFGLATGYGLDANVLDAYKFLVRNYNKGDEIYLLGFSRGAHTVRVLAGFINMVGVLQSHQEHLSSYALTAYKQSGTNDEFDIAWRVQEVLESHRATIRFMGCWDTVASVIVPRPDRFYLPALPQLFKSNPFVKDEKADPQDIKQVWFAGVHSDIGGGYPEQESGAAKYPLEWMVKEAKQHGLVFRETMVKRLVKGQNPRNVKEGSKRDYTAPSPTAKLHDSMTWGWRILEFIPKKLKWHDNPEKNTKRGFYIPLSEPRFIPTDAEIHPSVYERLEEGSYSPPNLPKQNAE